MKILFILKKEPDPTIKILMAEASKEAEILIHDLRATEDYDALIEGIEECDKVITW